MVKRTYLHLAGNGKGGCGSILLINKSDVLTTTSNSMGRCEETYNTFQCIECGAMTDIGSVPFKSQSKENYFLNKQAKINDTK